mgnify:CR=1 FL=1
MTKTIKKSDIVDHLNKKLGLNKTESKEIIENFFSEITDTLMQNEDVKLSGFGNFELIQKKERPGRNPKTGEGIIVSARRVVTFRAGQKLRGKVSSQHE